jgi:arsenate reductase
MAEALLKRYAGDRFEVPSAGRYPTEINPYVRCVMEEIGLDLDGQRPQPLNQRQEEIYVDHLITLCSYAQKSCPLAFNGLGHGQARKTPVCSSEDETLQKFRQMRDQVDQHIRAWLEETGTQEPPARAERAASLYSHLRS